MELVLYPFAILFAVAWLGVGGIYYSFFMDEIRRKLDVDSAPLHSKVRGFGWALAWPLSFYLDIGGQ